MKYAKITAGIVEQVQPYAEAGFTEVPDNVIPGMIDNGDGTFSNPPPAPAPDAQSATVNQLLEELAARGLEDSLFSAMTPAQQRRFLGAKDVPKDHPLTVEFLTAQGFTEADITDLFNKAAQR